MKLADVILLTFDVANRSSYDSIKSKWIQLIKNHAKHNHLLFIVANKIDIQNDIKVLDSDIESLQQ
jgi:GTPase SAR1 family protein